jgi:hypothetical protein
MPHFKVAHVREQGVDVVIVPLESSFGHKMTQDQNAIRADLQRHSESAGLAGGVVPVWDAGGGRMGFLAPHNQQSFFKSINLHWVARNINGELSW